MRVSTRSLLTGSAVLVLLMLPLEMVSFDLLTRGRPLSVSDAWVRRMSADQRREAAGRIEQYPVAYRKSLLAGLGPADRAAVWHRHTAEYLEHHPNLTIPQRAAVETLLKYATTDTFEHPATTAAARSASAQLVREQLGKAAYDELFLRSSTATAWSSPLPLRVALEGFVNAQFVVSADPNCNCNVGSYSYDCGTGWTCSQTVGCNFRYIGCGIWYESACDGYCLNF
jgi:hypothetical protein